MHDNNGRNGRSAYAGHVSRQRQAIEPAVDIEVPAYFDRKSIWMRCLGGVLLALLSPVMLLVMLLVRLTSPGPALFRQKRLGQNGKEFEILKIRTMYRDAEAVTGPTLCQPGDSRMTPVGRLLRLFHLDELPQLINVVRGEMCLVGPRPERPEIIFRNRLRDVVPGFDERTKVLPGVTGLAQINLPADVDAESVIPKVQLDLHYIQTATAGLDFRILACTALRMIGIRHGHAVRLLGLQRSTSICHEIWPAEEERAISESQLGGAVSRGRRRAPVAAVVFASTSANGDGRHNGFAAAAASLASDPVTTVADDPSDRPPATTASYHRPR